MLFDTDVLIWYLRGNPKATEAFQKESERSISIVTYMELLQGARNKSEIKLIRSFLNDSAFTIIALSDNIGHRASIYMEEYCLEVDLGVADCLVAATAVEYNLQLCTANNKHYKPIHELQLKTFRP